MNSLKRHNAKGISPVIETQSLRQLGNRTGNLYRSISVVGKRSNQIGGQLKDELHKKLEEFASTTDNLEEVFENREQIEISKFYERLPHATILAMDEFVSDKIYYRYKDEK